MRASSRSPKMFEGLDRISELAMPFASTPPGSPRSWSKWRVIAPGKARLSKQHRLSVFLSRTLHLPRVLLGPGVLSNGSCLSLKNSEMSLRYSREIY